MEELLNFIHTDIVVVILSITTVLSVFWLFFNQIKMSKLENRYKEFINKFQSNDIEKTLKDYFLLANQVNEENKIILAETKNLEKRIDNCIQKIGIVRYNAFDDVGSELSFAVALLDKNDNGLVINGIYARNSSNIYSKPVIHGKSKYVLSDEEIKAIDEAINKN